MKTDDPAGWDTKMRIEALKAAREEGHQAGIEFAIRVIEGGSFLHPDAPVAQWAREAVEAIRRENGKR